ncbi:acyltransferase [Anaerobaca lacustris]|uniref:Acyltransferase n=1 Tax=Anaerobaca lacustris TaxID=3044600 RepID=A0AAW6TYB9_9BACT|nr:acyltransferase [Sedimentisphaerales bacterium M17dextr]
MGLEASQLLRDQVADDARPLSVSLPMERVGSIDWLRVLAAVGIVWFHTEGAPYRQIGYAGLPVFLLIFFSLITIRSTADPALGFLRRRWDRLLKPWLFWSVLYGALRLAKAVCLRDAGSFQEMLSFETILMGTHVHLWYLPYAFGSGFLVYWVNRRTAQIDHTIAAFAATGIGLLLLIVHALGLSTGRWVRPLPQWEFGLAAVPLGFAIGRCLMVPARRTQQFLLSTISLTTLATTATLSAICRSSSAIPYMLAVMLVCLAYGRRTNNSVIVALLAPLTFGVYLIHPLIDYGLRQLITSEQHCAAFIGLTVCLSGLVTLALMRTPVRRFV